MICKLEAQGDIAVVRVCDDISTDVLDDFRAFLKDEVFAEYVKIILVMEGVDYFCSSALGMVIRSMRIAREKGGNLVMVKLTPSVSRLMEVTRLESVIKILADVDEAIAFYEEAS